MTFIALLATELSATAFIRSCLGTTLGIRLWRTGSENDHAMPVARVKTNRCHGARYPLAASHPMSNAVTNRNCSARSKSLRRSTRSATTPAIGPATRKGMERAPFSTPSRIEEPVRSYINQPKVTC